MGWTDCNSTVFFDYSYQSYLSFEWAMKLADMQTNFENLLNRLAKQDLEPNPLPLLMRAVNSIKCHRICFQPRWSKLRWKSNT